MKDMPRLFLIVFAVNVGISFLIYLFFPSLRPLFIAEDGLVENLGAILFLLAGIAGLILLPRLRGKPGFRFQFIVLGLGFLGFLDEISFGARIFHFSTPTLFGYDFDGAHDIFMITKKTISHNMNFWMVCLLIVVMGPAAWFIVKRRKQIESYLRKSIKEYTPYRMFFIFLIILSTGILFDLGIIHAKILSFFEESFEMNAALALVFTAIAVGTYKPKVRTETNQEPLIED